MEEVEMEREVEEVEKKKKKLSFFPMANSDSVRVSIQPPLFFVGHALRALEGLPRGRKRGMAGGGQR